MSTVEVPPKEGRTSRIEENRKYLTTVIQYYLRALDNGRLPRDADGVLQVLSVGCGYAYEAQPVNDVFPNSRYKGIDDEKHIRLAMGLVNKDLPPDKVGFFSEDAREVNEDEIEKFGLVIIRHPQVMGAPLSGGSTQEDWRKIIEASIQKTKKKGYLFITAESDIEEDIVVSYLLKNRITVLLAQNNEFQPHAPSSLVFQDQRVIIGRK